MPTPEQTNPTVLVIGGTGTTGSRVVARLESQGRPVRIGSRSAQPPFVWEDPETWTAVLDGVDRVYIIHPVLGTPEAGEQIEAFARAAVARGIRRLVMLSGRGSSEVQAVEEGVKSAGAEWTIVRPGWFNQNFSEASILGFAELVKAGEIALPFGDAAEAFVDADDIAAVVVAALTDDRHVGKTYELSGPAMLSFAEVAAELSAATGREIVYTPLTIEQYREVVRKRGLPVEYADMFAGGLDGSDSHVVNGVEEALGRKPKDFSEYARETAATGVWDA
ncbi:NmrA family NAD(P)-binding protein [Nocardia pseudovaccinii]|uniref:NmrA family NAD(P)-binding protein n=1 Tax=Nocardia pseudovaccinii TaxID=189540 RepID=UPI003D8A5F1E